MPPCHRLSNASSILLVSSSRSRGFWSLYKSPVPEPLGLGESKSQPAAGGCGGNASPSQLQERSVPQDSLDRGETETLQRLFDKVVPKGTELLIVPRGSAMSWSLFPQGRCPPQPCSPQGFATQRKIVSHMWTVQGKEWKKCCPVTCGTSADAVTQGTVPTRSSCTGDPSACLQSGRPGDTRCGCPAGPET